MPVKITGNGLAAGFQVFYRKIYGFFLHCTILGSVFEQIIVHSCINVIPFTVASDLGLHCFQGSNIYYARHLWVKHFTFYPILNLTQKGKQRNKDYFVLTIFCYSGFR